MSCSKTEIDDMIRKPTNLLLTKTLKSALVELTAAESEYQLNFSQVNSFKFLNFNIFRFSACSNLYQYITFRKCNALFRRLYCCFSSVSHFFGITSFDYYLIYSGSTKQMGLRLQGASMLKVTFKIYILKSSNYFFPIGYSKFSRRSYL